MGSASYDSDTNVLTCTAYCGCDLAYSNCSIKAGDCWGIQLEKGQRTGEATVRMTLTRWIDRHTDSDVVCAARFAGTYNEDFVDACRQFCQPFFNETKSVSFPASCVTPKAVAPVEGAVQLQKTEAAGAVQGE